MKGDRIGPYLCAGCGDRFHISDTYQFGGGFRPAALLTVDNHPMYWQGDRNDPRNKAGFGQRAK